MCIHRSTRKDPENLITILSFLLYQLSWDIRMRINFVYRKSRHLLLSIIYIYFTFKSHPTKTFLKFLFKQGKIIIIIIILLYLHPEHIFIRHLLQKYSVLSC